MLFPGEQMATCFVRPARAPSVPPRTGPYGTVRRAERRRGATSLEVAPRTAPRCREAAARQPPLDASVSPDAMSRRAPCQRRSSEPLRSNVVSITRPDFTLAWMKRPSPR